MLPSSDQLGKTCLENHFQKKMPQKNNQFKRTKEQSHTSSWNAPVCVRCGHVSSTVAACLLIARWENFGAPSLPIIPLGVVLSLARQCAPSSGWSGSPGTGWCSITSRPRILTCGIQSRSNYDCGWLDPLRQVVVHNLHLTQNSTTRSCGDQWMVGRPG